MASPRLPCDPPPTPRAQDCFQAIPYLWIVGPFNSGKTTLLKLLWCFCRRGLIAGDLRAASVYRLTSNWDPTLIIDELDSATSSAGAELYRLLRSGSTPGVPAMRNGQPFKTYGLKIISSRQPPSDAALLSRGLVVPMLPAIRQLEQLTQPIADGIVKEFQAKLLTFRLTNYAAVKNFSLPSDVFPGPSSRIKQVAHALSAPLLGDPTTAAQLLDVLRSAEDDARGERLLESEWLVTYALFDICHDEFLLSRGASVSEIYVGALTARVNGKLNDEGEDFRLGARKVGAVLTSLGLPAERLDRAGRGLKFTSVLKRKIHQLAGRLGIDRRSTAFSGGLEAGNGGTPCSLCSEFGLTDGLRFVGHLNKSAPLKSSSPRRGSLFERRDVGGNREPSEPEQAP